MSVLFIKDGVRYAREQLSRSGIAPGDEPAFGYVELDAAIPGDFDPALESLVDGGTDETGPIPRVRWVRIPRDLPDARAALAKRLAERRWQAETGGTVINGAVIRTDRESRGNLMGLAVRSDMAIRDGEEYAVDYKTPTGFVTLDAAAVIAVAKAAEAHVRACFAAEAQFTAEIAAAETVDQLRTIAARIDSGWPQAQ